MESTCAAGVVVVVVVNVQTQPEVLFCMKLM